MSSHGDDTEVNVCSSPEPSPQGCGNGSNHHSDDEVHNYHPHLTHLSHITRHPAITNNNNHNSSILNNITHHHLNNNNTISASNNNNNTTFLNGDSRLSPSKTPPDTPNTTPSKNCGSGFTSFSISSILSRSDSASKKVNGTNISSTLSAAALPLTCTGGGMHGAQDAAMISR